MKLQILQEKQAITDITVTKYIVVVAVAVVVVVVVVVVAVDQVQEI